jgi:Ser/Thr protein kinase RdoA (MazF antagonist)
MERGELLGSGRMADVFALDERRVLRRYRDGTDATAEAEVMTLVAQHGYPVPAVFPAPGGARRTDLVLERLSGPTMAAAVLGGELTPDDAGRILARLLNELHRIPARVSDAPGTRVLHLDLHPENVLMTPRGPVVIDWANAAEGPPGYDRAVSALILAEAAVGGVPDDLAERVRPMLAALLAHLDGAGGPAHEDAAVWAADRERARALRAANTTLSHEEVGRLGRASGLVVALSPGAGSTAQGRR